MTTTVSSTGDLAAIARLAELEALVKKQAKELSKGRIALLESQVKEIESKADCMSWLVVASAISTLITSFFSPSATAPQALAMGITTTLGCALFRNELTSGVGELKIKIEAEKEFTEKHQEKLGNDVERANFIDNFVKEKLEALQRKESEKKPNFIANFVANFRTGRVFRAVSRA